jgi:hypothetical protein
MRSELEQQIFTMYEHKQLLRNPYCCECQTTSENSGRPFYGLVGIWQAGSRFREDPYRILFVGKTACGDPEDPTDWADKAIMGKIPRAKRSRYWTYTREVIEKVYGPEKRSLPLGNGLHSRIS